METQDENGNLHLHNDKPAKTYCNVKEWYCHSKLHQDDNNKPARIVGNSHKEYWVHGKRQ